MPPADFYAPKFDTTQNKWVEGKTAAELFQIYQNQKIAQLAAIYEQTLANGFTSSALGVAHTYPADTEARNNFNVTVLRFLTDPTYTTTNFKTLDAGFLAHTKDQFFQVFADGHNFGIQQNTHYNQKKAAVLALSYPTNTKADIDGITW